MRIRSLDRVDQCDVKFDLVSRQRLIPKIGRE